MTNQIFSFDCEMNVDKSLIFLNCLLKRNHIVKCIGYITLCCIYALLKHHTLNCLFTPATFIAASYSPTVAETIMKGIIIWKEYFHIEMTNCPNMSGTTTLFQSRLVKAIKIVLLLLNKRTSVTLTVQLGKKKKKHTCNWIFPRKIFDD